MKKISSYQKLKKRNQELINDLYKIVIKKDEKTMLYYKTMFGIDEFLLSGDATDKDI